MNTYFGKRVTHFRKPVTPRSQSRKICHHLSPFAKKPRNSGEVTKLENLSPSVTQSGEGDGLGDKSVFVVLARARMCARKSANYKTVTICHPSTEIGSKNHGIRTSQNQVQEDPTNHTRREHQGTPN